MFISTAGVMTNTMVQQPVMAGRLDAGSPITFPEEQEDPLVSGDVNTGGSLWGFFKVTARHVTDEAAVRDTQL